MNPNITRWLFVLVSILLVSASVSAIGISPGNTQFEFTPGLHDVVTLKVVNTEQKEMDVILYTEGSLENYITLSKNQLHFTKDELEKEVTYTLALPDKLGDPGKHGGQIIAREVGKQEDGELVVRALLAVGSAVEVRVPYPGKYITSHFYVEPTTEMPVQLLLQLHNLGQQDIQSAQAVIDILDEDGKVVATLETEKKEILASKRIDLLTEWTGAVTYGQYTAEATIKYDGITTTASQPFRTGNLGLEPVDISVNDFTLGEVAKFNVLVRNTLTQDVEKAAARIVLYTQEDATLANFASIDTLVPATAVKALLSYWDTEGVEKGTYEGVLTLTADGISSDHRLRTTVTENEIKTEFVSITGLAISSGSEFKTLGKEASIALLTVIVIIANVIGWYFYFRKKDKGKMMDDF